MSQYIHFFHLVLTDYENKLVLGLLSKPLIHYVSLYNNAKTCLLSRALIRLFSLYNSVKTWGGFPSKFSKRPQGLMTCILPPLGPPRPTPDGSPHRRRRTLGSRRLHNHQVIFGCVRREYQSRWDWNTPINLPQNTSHFASIIPSDGSQLANADAFRSFTKDYLTLWFLW